MVRWGGTILAYLFLSLAYSLVSLAFQINFSGGNPVTSETQPTLIEYGNPTAYGRGTFPVYWMLNFVGMAALGLACENVAMVVGQPWTGLWLIFVSILITIYYHVYGRIATDSIDSGSLPTSRPHSTTSTLSPASSTTAMATRYIMSWKEVGRYCSICIRG